MGQTQFIETEALLLALEEGESERLANYLEENFLPGELEKLRQACRDLSWMAAEVQAKRRG